MDFVVHKKEHCFLRKYKKIIFVVYIAGTYEHHI